VVDGVEKGVYIALDHELMGLEQSFGSVDGFDRGFTLLVGVAAVAKTQMRRELFIEDLLDDFSFGVRDGDDASVAVCFGQRERDMRSETKKVILWRWELESGSLVGDTLFGKYLIEGFVKNRALGHRKDLCGDGGERSV